MPRDVKHLTRRRAPGWRTFLVILGTDGQIDEASDIVENVGEGGAGGEMRLCPITGFDPSAIQWSMPRMLRQLALDSPEDNPLPAVRVWVRAKALYPPSEFDRTDRAPALASDKLSD